MSATSRPWAVGGTFPASSFIVEGSDVIAKCDSRDHRANAELIVRAVNSHEALVEALKALLEDYMAFLGDGVTEANEPDLVTRVRAALALAEEK